MSTVVVNPLNSFYFIHIVPLTTRYFDVAKFIILTPLSLLS